jgi:hypothetical protein
MVTRRWIFALQVLFLITLVACLIVWPVIASSPEINPNPPGDITIHTLGPVVSGTNQNSTIISMIADVACTPVIGYSNDSFFSVSGSYDHELFDEIGLNQ